RSPPQYSSLAWMSRFLQLHRLTRPFRATARQRHILLPAVSQAARHQAYARRGHGAVGISGAAPNPATARQRRTVGRSLPDAAPLALFASSLQVALADLKLHAGTTVTLSVRTPSQREKR